MLSVMLGFGRNMGSDRRIVARYVAGGARLGQESAGGSGNSAQEGNWEWGGCGDNVNYGYKKSKAFMDSPYRKRSDIKTLVKLHNNDAGRLVSPDCE